MTAYIRYVVHVPENLPMDAAAPLLCAGITVYSPMKDNNLLDSSGSPKKVGIVGLGGLGHVAVKFAKAFGHHVTVISTSPSKEEEAKHRLAAHDFIVSTDPSQMQVLSFSAFANSFFSPPFFSPWPGRGMVGVGVLAGAAIGGSRACVMGWVAVAGGRWLLGWTTGERSGPESAGEGSGLGTREGDVGLGALQSGLDREEAWLGWEEGPTAATWSAKIGVAWGATTS
ncbi:hypothetical protein Cgig2_008469 [Carnegiea gigantea]|uniref:D-isomer specific 2-hydroxyacid dehydrogenase NAD-binding domain-containing protein n=1 Tax=Carnegiea gigantea TaxID=171969 RepID=A0A9Q1JUA7_9CARY|nr:hypothetical protein Cgig2_008469 [Carnegiea gigantea]